MQKVRDAYFALPGIEEQVAIAAFLDQETSEMDELITKYENLIALLEEKRESFVNHAVTKGLDNGVGLKDTGIEWIGSIPSHWTVKRIKYVARLESGHTPDKKVDAYWENGTIPWVSLNDTAFLKENDYIDETAYFTTEEGLANSSAHLLPPRTVVFSRDATIGRCAIILRSMAVSQHFIGWVCGVEIIPEFLLRALRTMAQELDRVTFGATLKTIGMPDVKSLCIPLPPVEEQARIVAKMQVFIQTTQQSIDRTKSALALLRERRSALITNAVTGQIDISVYTANDSSEDSVEAVA